MWRKLIFFVIVLSAVQDLGYSRQISRSYLYELARLMDVVLDPVRSCTSGCCVEIRHERGTTEKILLDIDKSVYSSSDDDSCELYVCKESGLSHERLMKSDCLDIICPSGQVLLTLPDSCCPRCYAVDEPPANCTFSEWSEYGRCSVTCGGGLKVRRRRFLGVDNGASRVNCSGNLIETMSCSENECPVNCTYTWGEYDRCSVTCGGGTRTRRPIITRPAEHGGYCPGPETVTCNTNHCPKPCVYEWGEYGDCNVTCGRGTKTRRPIIRVPAQHGGYCPGPETVECEGKSCSCQWEWGEYGKCSKTCGEATRTRYPIITNPAGPRGYCQPHVINEEPQTEYCNLNRCPGCECPCTCSWYRLCNEECTTPEQLKPHKTACTPDKATCECPPGSIKCKSVCFKKKEGNNSCEDCEPRSGEDDLDQDGWNNLCDNCVTIYNPEQRDSDGDGTADACENTFPGKLLQA